MSCDKRKKFLECYEETRSAGYVFNFDSELKKYCRNDTIILKLACLKFRKTFFEVGDIYPFTEATMIASACMKVYRKKFLNAYTIGILPARGYRFGDNQSFVALRWLVWMELELGRDIQHAGKGREYVLPINVKVDGFCEPLPWESHKGVCLQMMGCYWHGCIRCYQRNRDTPLSENSSETMEDRYSKTIEICKIIESNNYNLIVKWECEFNE